MPHSAQLDSIEYQSLDLPYSLVERELSEEPRLVSGSLNTYVTMGGKIVKRGGTIQLSNVAAQANLRIDRLWVYETMEATPHIYLIASAYSSTSSNWGLYYCEPSNGGWIAASNVRQINASTRAHEGAQSHGYFFVKGFPTAASGEKLGTVLLDGTGGTMTTTIWGMLGPTTPARINGAINRISNSGNAISSSATSIVVTATTGFPAAPFNVWVDYEAMTVTAVAGTTLTVLRGAQGTTAAAHADQSPVLYRGWSSSTHPVTVQFGWKYSYAYQDTKGHISNRAPVETNPDNLPSSTGPFLNYVPSIVVQGNSDTTNIPKIVIFRTMDGGGTYYKIDTITNSGAGNITYLDNTLVSAGGAKNDPIPDTSLSQNSFAPDLNSNSPPPTVISPLVVGTDTPATNATPIAVYAGRLWYGIGNILFYSANEELPDGIPEMAFPTGTLGNFFRYPEPVLNVLATTNALYVFCTHSVHMITGTLKQTFNSNPILYNIGTRIKQPRAITRYQDAVVFLTNDNRVGIVQGGEFRTISDPLGTDFLNHLNGDDTVQLAYWAGAEKEFLVFLSASTTAANPTASRLWVYDIKKSERKQQDFWNAPWSVPATAVLACRPLESSSLFRLIFGTYDGSMSLAYWDDTLITATDDYPQAAKSLFDFTAITNLFTVPLGNHVNPLRKPSLNPEIYELRVERTAFAGDTDPQVLFFCDDLWTNPLAAAKSEAPPRHDAPRGYYTLAYPVERVVQRIGFQVNKLQSTERFEIQNLVVVFAPDLGD